MDSSLDHTGYFLDKITLADRGRSIGREILGLLAEELLVLGSAVDGVSFGFDALRVNQLGRDKGCANPPDDEVARGKSSKLADSCERAFGEGTAFRSHGNFLNSE